MSSTEGNTEIDLGYAVFFKRRDGIIQVNAKAHTYSVEELKEGLKHMQKICEEHRYPFLFVAERNSMLDSSALKYFSTPGLLSFSGARAYVLKSRTQRMLAAIFVSERNNDSPAKTFRDVEEAAAWLLKRPS